MRFEPTYTSLFERLLANSTESEQYAHRGCACWVWTGRIRSAYPYITIRVPGKRNPQSFRAHRVMAEVVAGRALDPAKETIDHGCEIPWCINYWHFRLATLGDNSRELATLGDNSRDRHRRDAGKPRLVMPYLIDPKLYVMDPLIRELPRLRSELSFEVPF